MAAFSTTVKVAAFPDVSVIAADDYCVELGIVHGDDNATILDADEIKALRKALKRALRSVDA